MRDAPGTSPSSPPSRLRLDARWVLHAGYADRAYGPWDCALAAVGRHAVDGRRKCSVGVVHERASLAPGGEPAGESETFNVRAFQLFDYGRGRACVGVCLRGYGVRMSKSLNMTQQKKLKLLHVGVMARFRMGPSTAAPPR